MGQQHIPNRRHVLAGLMAAPAVVGTSQAFAARDEMAELIAEYRRQFAIYCAAPDDLPEAEDDALAAATYLPAWDRLWDNPPRPTTNRGAAEALRLASERMGEMTNGIEIGLIGVVLAYLEDAE